jgi:hypothetical protein
MPPALCYLATPLTAPSSSTLSGRPLFHFFVPSGISCCFNLIQHYHRAPGNYKQFDFRAIYSGKEYPKG